MEGTATGAPGTDHPGTSNRAMTAGGMSTYGGSAHGSLAVRLRREPWSAYLQVPYYIYRSPPFLMSATALTPNTLRNTPCAGATLSSYKKLCVSWPETLTSPLTSNDSGFLHHPLLSLPYLMRVQGSSASNHFSENSEGLCDQITGPRFECTRSSYPYSLRMLTLPFEIGRKPAHEHSW